MPALISLSFFSLSLILVKVSDTLALTSKADELVTGHTLLGKGQEEILVKERSIKGVPAGFLIRSFNTCG